MCKTYMTYFDAAKNSNKFWSVDIQNEKIIYNWGRVGADGQTKVVANTYTEQRKAEKKIDEKINKGYRKVDINEIQTTASATTIDSKVANFLKDIYEASHSYMLNKAGDQFRNLTLDTINEGRTLLNKIVSYINTNRGSVRYYSNEYFKTIPHKLSRKISENEWVLDTMDKINAEMELLDDYEQNVSVINFSIDDVYNNLNATLRTVDDKEMEYVTNKVVSSVAYNHHYNLRILNAFKVEQTNAPAYDTTRGNDTHLFHGTRKENVLGILNTNLKLPNTLKGVVKTGAMFGPGLYFANNSSKSANYSFGYWSGSDSDKAYLFITKVALGNVYETEQSHYFTEAPNGYDSVMGKKGRYLYNNEFIVYNENQVQIEYVIEVEKF